MGREKGGDRTGGVGRGGVWQARGGGIVGRNERGKGSRTGRGGTVGRERGEWGGGLDGVSRTREGVCEAEDGASEMREDGVSRTGGGAQGMGQIGGR